jgi:hypothetical protein
LELAIFADDVAVAVHEVGVLVRRKRVGDFCAPGGNIV